MKRKICASFIIFMSCFIFSIFYLLFFNIKYGASILCECSDFESLITVWDVVNIQNIALCIYVIGNELSKLRGIFDSTNVSLLSCLFVLPHLTNVLVLELCLLCNSAWCLPNQFFSSIGSCICVFHFRRYVRIWDEKTWKKDSLRNRALSK